MISTPLIHIVDDDDALATALLRLLAAGGYEARRYASAGDFLLHLPADRPGCLLLDIQMPGPSGLELHASLKQLGVHLPVVFLTAHANVSTSVGLMKAGVVDVLEKPAERLALFAALQRALALDAEWRCRREQQADIRRRFATLTPRELMVLRAVVDGQLNKQIGEQLGMAERTVKLERARIMSKLEVSSLAELIQLAAEFQQLP